MKAPPPIVNKFKLKLRFFFKFLRFDKFFAKNHAQIVFKFAIISFIKANESRFESLCCHKFQSKFNANAR